MRQPSTKNAPSTQVEEPREPPSPSRRIITAKLARVRSGHGFKLTRNAPPPPPAPVRRPARVALMLALAHRLQQAIARGDYASRADLAQALDLTRARISQLLDLTLIAPDIQEELLDLEAVDGLEPLSERAIRPLTCMTSWAEQRAAWATLKQERMAGRGSA